MLLWCCRWFCAGCVRVRLMVMVKVGYGVFDGNGGEELVMMARIVVMVKIRVEMGGGGRWVGVRLMRDISVNIINHDDGNYTWNSKSM